MNNNEREIYNACACLTDEMISQKYPKLCEEDEIVMSLTYDDKRAKVINVFGFLRTNADGEDYIEIDFYNERMFSPSNYRRFVISRGKMLEENAENEYMNLVRDSHISIDDCDFVYLQEAFRECFPDIPIKVYEENHKVGVFLDRIYFSTHRSGTREILYKAGLDEIAYYVGTFLDYNERGKNPEEILGLPLKLLRIINEAKLCNRLILPELREYTYKLYKYVSDYCDKNELPNMYQWQYLEECGENVDIGVFRYLKDCTGFREYINTYRFRGLRNDLGKYCKYKKYPDIHNLDSIIYELAVTMQYLNKRESINQDFYKNYWWDYDYENEKYIVITPHKVEDIIFEAVKQNNCLVSLLHEILNGYYRILFVRRKSDVDKPYITLGLDEETEMLDARGKNNRTLTKEEYAFVELVAKEYGFKVNYC